MHGLIILLIHWIGMTQIMLKIIFTILLMIGVIGKMFGKYSIIIM